MAFNIPKMRAEMTNVYRRAVRADVLALCALALTAALTLPTSSASAASSKTPHARYVATRSHAEVRDNVACTRAGCKLVPAQCHAAPQAGQEPGYQVIVCP
ncbi:MAG: hypothetical protein JSR61_04585 [Proteobacteria bacterium]|nr:hypothetical protein [Pseudomonadota bacterium]